MEGIGSTLAQYADTGVVEALHDANDVRHRAGKVMFAGLLVHFYRFVEQSYTQLLFSHNVHLPVE